jgi:chromosome segregation ATPase
MSDGKFDLVLSAIAEMRSDIQAEVNGLHGNIRDLRTEMRDRFDRLETKTDNLSREMERVLTRLSATEVNALTGQLTIAALQSRLNDYGVRIELIEKRLELRDKP